MAGIGAPPYPTLEHGLWDEWSLANREGFSNLGTYNPASRLPSGAPSDHARNPSRAFDAGFSPETGWDNPQARHFFNEMKGRPGIHYVILGDKIWSTDRGLHEYTAGGHEGHVHVSGTGADTQAGGGGGGGGYAPGQAADVVEYIAQGAFIRGDDPGVYLAVATHEGLRAGPGNPGDGGTSHGPFMLHEGGALPAGLDHPDQWAWSKAGLDYAMDRIDRVVPDRLQGRNAIELMVRDFERPRDPEAQIQKSVQTYQQARAHNALPPTPSEQDAQFISSGGDFIVSDKWKPWHREFWWHSPDIPGTDLGGIGGAAKGVGGAIIPDAIEDFFKKALWPFLHPGRFAMIVVGALVAIVGFVLLGKHFGVPMPIPGGARLAGAVMK